MTEDKRFHKVLVDKWPLILAVLIFVAFAFAGCQQFITGQPPIAIIEALTSTVGEAPLTVQFSGAQSSDPDGTIASFSWDFGDGSTGTSQTVSHEFTGQARYKVVLTVTDADGLVDKDHIFIDTLSNPASIYFASNRVQTPSVTYEIFKMNTNGNNQTRVTVDPYGDDVFPDLLPNTRLKLAFSSNRSGGDFDIFKSNADGTLSENLTPSQTASAEIQPTWKPDGSKIAFATDKDSAGNFNIYTVDVDTGSLTSVTSQTQSLAPDWSPDGEWIAFASNRGTNFEIYKIKPDGTGLQNLTNNVADDGALGLAGSFGLPGGVGISSPSWSPDGTQIAFTSDRDGGDLDIFIMDNNGTSQTQLTSSSANDFDPFWLPNGQEIAFVSDRGTGLQIYKINVSTRTLTGPLTSVGTGNIIPADEP